MQKYQDILDLVGYATAVVFISFLFACSILGNTSASVESNSTQDVVMMIYKPNESKHIAVTPKFVTHCDVTIYHPVKRECNEDPEHTASNLKIDFDKLKKGELHYCAISRDLLWKIPFNSIIHIDGHGEYLVCDLLNARYTHRIDIMLHPSNPTMFKEEKVKVTLL